MHRPSHEQNSYFWEVIMGGALISIVFILALVASPTLA